MTECPFRYIVVEGPIGVGKTTLARRLARSLGAELILETPEENPFLPRFYESSRRYALPTQLYFLLQRARQLEKLHQSDMFSPVRVADSLIDKDRLFAEVNLDPDELELYRQVYAQVIGAPPAPDLVVYLQAPATVLKGRITARGVPYERGLNTRYLQAVADAYTRFFYHYESAPLLIVNAADIDLTHNDGDYRALLEQVKGIRRGRHYFNLLPF